MSEEFSHVVQRTRNRHHIAFSEEQESKWKGPFCFIQAADTQLGLIDRYIKKVEEDAITWTEEIEKTKLAIRVWFLDPASSSFAGISSTLSQVRTRFMGSKSCDEALRGRSETKELVEQEYCISGNLSQEFNNVRGTEKLRREIGVMSSGDSITRSLSFASVGTTISAKHQPLKISRIAEDFCGTIQLKTCEYMEQASSAVQFMQTLLRDDNSKLMRSDFQNYVRAFGSEDYFSFWCGGVYNIVLNSQFFEDPSQVKHLAELHMRWIDEQLAIAQSKRATHIFVFQHIPFFLEAADEVKDYFNLDNPLRTIMLEKFATAGVEGIFCGHYHRNAGGKYKDMEEVVTTAVGAVLRVNEPSGLRVVNVYQEGFEHRYYPLEEIPVHSGLRIN